MCLVFKTEQEIAVHISIICVFFDKLLYIYTYVYKYECMYACVYMYSMYIHK